LRFARRARLSFRLGRDQKLLGARNFLRSRMTIEVCASGEADLQVGLRPEARRGEEIPEEQNESD
jgi:hypothetical protein